MGAAGGQRKEAAANEIGRGERERATERLIERWPGGSGVISCAGVSVSARAGVPHRRKW